MKSEAAEKFGKWLLDSVGISADLLNSLETDDDWTFVIKTHGILEAGLNHLLLTKFGNPKLGETVSRLETNNARTGKIAFIKAFNLLSPEALLFVRLLSEVRNRAVHDVKHFNLKLETYLESLNKEQRDNWKTALTSWVVSRPIPEGVRDLAIKQARNGIYNSCMMIIIRSLEHQRAAEAERNFLKAAEEFAEQLEKEKQSSEPDQSSPTE